MIESLGAVARVLDRADVEWAVLRWARAPAEPAGDVDVLVDSRGHGRAVAAFVDAGFVELRWSQPPSRGLVRFEAQSGSWLWVDLHPAPPGLSVTDTPRLLARRRRDDGAWFLDPADEFWLLLIDALFNGRRLRDRHRRRLLSLLPHIGWSPAEAWLDRRAGTLVQAGMVRELVASGQWHELIRLGSAWSQRHPPIGRRLRRGVAAALDPSQRGLSIALLGPDGAGKSSTQEALASSYPFDSRCIYMGVGAPPGSRRSLLSTTLLSATNLAAQWVRYVVGRYHQFRGRLVLFDRYMEDPWLPQPPGRPAWRRVGHQMRRALACPAADVMVVLDVPGEVMYARKREHDPAWLEVQRQRYRELARGEPGIALVDAGQPHDQVVREISALLWKEMRSRHVAQMQR